MDLGQLLRQAEELGDEGSGLVHQSCRGVPGDELPFAKEKNFLGNGLHVRHHVCGQEDNSFRGNGGDIVPDSNPLLWVQPGGGFIQKKHLGRAQEGLHQQNPLTHAAGKAAHFFVETV